MKKLLSALLLSTFISSANAASIPYFTGVAPTPSDLQANINSLITNINSNNSNPTPTNLIFPNNIVYAGSSVVTLGSITGGSGYTQNASILTLGSITPGSGYTQGTYNNVALTGGSGTGAQAQIVVGPANTVVKVVITARGQNYSTSDTLGATIPGGSGFSIPVASVGQIYTLPLTGGSGTGATANITINSSGAVSSVGLIARGTGYTNTDTLSASIPGGSGFSVPVASIGAVGGPPLVWESIYGNSLTGTLSVSDATGTTAPLQFYIGNDTVAGIGLALMQVEDGVGNGFAGGRIAVQGKLVVNGVPSVAPTSGLTGVTGQVTLNSNLTGTGASYTTYVGGGFGANAQVIATQNATFITLVNGDEFDVECQLGCTTAEKHGITIVETAGDATRAVYDDSALEIANQDGANQVGWATGINFGSYAHLWPFTSTSTLIGITNRVVPSGGTSPANIGVDMSNGTFTTAQYKGTNFLVDPNGNAFVGRTTVLTIGDSLSVFKSNNGPGGMTVDNNNGGTATYTTINIGNGNSTQESMIILNGSSGTETNGANALTIANAGGTIFLQAGSTTQGTNVAEKLTSTTVTLNGGIINTGTAPTLTTGTCSGSSWTGGATFGKFTAATCSAGTYILSGLPTAPNGYICDAQDQTTSADTLKQTANTTTSCTLTSTTAASDVVVVHALAF